MTRRKAPERSRGLFRFQAFESSVAPTPSPGECAVSKDSAVGLVAYQGVPGAFGEAAIERVWGTTARAFPVPTFSAALEALRNDDVMWAVIPVWNSCVGDVPSTRDALETYA